MPLTLSVPKSVTKKKQGENENRMRNTYLMKGPQVRTPVQQVKVLGVAGKGQKGGHCTFFNTPRLPHTGGATGGGQMENHH